MTAHATTPSSPRPLDARAASILTLCCLIWGVGLVMVKIANTGISPVMNAALRSIAATVVLLAWVYWRGVRIGTADGTLTAGVVAGVVFAVEFITLYLGLVNTDAARATIFLHCAPFVAAAGEHVLVPGHRLTAPRLLGLLAAFAGMAIALADAAPGRAPTLYGDVLCLIAGICWGAVSLIIKVTPLRAAPPEKSLLYQLAVSAPILVAWSYLIGEAGVTRLSPEVVAAFLYSVLLVVVFGYTTWIWLMRTYSVANLHAFTFLTPLFGAIAGAVILGESLGRATIVGLLLVALGIYLVNRPARSPS